MGPAATAGWERGGQRGYNTAAITLHWLIALTIVVQTLLGWWMNEWTPDHTPFQSRLEGIHISLGVTILILVLVRIAVRLLWPPPPLPTAIPPIERAAATVTHTLFYIMMLVQPLSGWMMESLGDKPIHVWGLPWPHMPGVHALFGDPAPKAIHHTITHLHVFIFMWIIVVTLILHVAAALWGQLGGQPIFWRMIPGAKPARGR
jgi:cytochrome b561